MQGELYGTYKLSKCGELNHGEEKINVKLVTRAYNMTPYNEEKEEVNSVFCELNVPQTSSCPTEPSD